MIGGLRRFALLALAALPPAFGQFQLYLINGAAEQPVPAIYDFGQVDPGLSAAARFRIRNASTAAATLDYLAVRGSGFTLTSAPSLPASLAPQQSVDFTVVFQSAGSGASSATLDSVGIAVLLTATVPVELTCQVDTGAGLQPLGSAPVDFGTVERGSSAAAHVVLLNQTAVPLIVPGISVTGAAFGLSNPSPAGLLLQPTESAGFDVQFAPGADGVLSGSLAIGSRDFPLTGTGIEPSLPQPRVTISLPQPQSAQQGTVTVNLNPPSKASGTGTVTIGFQPLSAGATDPAIAFASGGRTATFTVSPGDTQGHFGAQLTVPFQTGTTAGTLTILVQLGPLTDQQIIGIQPAAVGLTAAQGLRSSGAVEIDLTGFDNTRTAGPLSFTFYDAAGAPLAPGPIRTDSTATFAGYFQSSSGGTFLLKAIFPVAGDATQIKSFEAAVTNSAGVAITARTNF
ncbi:MAG TPA: choice-of-anchor D domain-containing protein [Bryobacteraceae bacterium]|nr:choice-of-anchor D domain-containing protein [Bryobacteraceae bacterium]